MTTDFIQRHSPQPGIATAPSVLAARAAVRAAARDLASIPDDAMEKAWRWRDSDADVRYGLFRPIEAVEEATAEIAGILAATGATRGGAAERIAQGTVPRWQLHGRLAGIPEGSLDTVAKEGEWTLRETLAHIVGSQLGYASFTAWYWQRNVNGPPTDEEVEALAADAALPEDSTLVEGSLEAIGDTMDELTDLTAALATIPDEDLGRWARWSGIPVDIGFRLGRPSSHVMEHAIQLDKTLAWLGHAPTEAQRIARDLCDAYGRLEARVWPMDPAALAARDAAGRSVDDVLAALSVSIQEDARTTVAAAAAA